MATNDGRPETVYELCEMVCEAIELRPLNYNQGSWCRDAKESTGNDEACGTAFCRAGWMVALLQKDSGYISEYEIVVQAHRLLTDAGIPVSSIESLFDGGAVAVRAYDLGLPQPHKGTPSYAQLGVDGMQEFMQEHEQRLRHTRINQDNTTTRMEGHPDGPS